jgi:shikimate kinase
MIRVMNLFLVGYRCTGKTTVGKVLAVKLGLNFVDADQMVSAETGLDIAAFVDKMGWEAFRKKERQVISRLSQQNGQVIAAGGGVVTVPENVTTMRSSGTVIWLKESLETIRTRMQADHGTVTSRPSLTGQGSIEEIDEVLVERDRLYARAADHFIDTDVMSIAQIVEKIIVLTANDFETRSTDKPA